MADTCTKSCHPQSKGPSFDFVFWGSTAIILLSLILGYSGLEVPYVQKFAHSVSEFLLTLWWGVLLGVILVGIMSKIPKEYFMAVLGRGDTIGGLLRATIAGLFLDLCSHGILMVGAKLYERGASTAQVMTFLIASPWNSLSLTIILASLIGLKWTLLFIAGSAVIAIVTGFVFQKLENFGVLQKNPHTLDSFEKFSVLQDAKQRLKTFRPNLSFVLGLFKNSMKEAKILVRWLLLGIIIAASMRTFIPTEIFSTWFGPGLLGLLTTLLVTTIIETCSEGSTPVAAEIFNVAHAPGNAFAFLMAGVSTDYTEIMVLRDVTQSWKTALFLPLLTVPQILILGHLMNG